MIVQQLANMTQEQAREEVEEMEIEQWDPFNKYLNQTFLPMIGQSGDIVNNKVSACYY